MKRNELVNAVDELKDSDNIENDIVLLKDLAVSFCDHYESEFNRIRDALDGLSSHSEAAKEAYEVAENCSSDLY